MRPFFTATTLCVQVLFWAALGLAQSPALKDVKTVYFWPMHGSLDQYLAEQLSIGGPFQVVVDPKLADAIITERIDAPFLKAMDEVFPVAPSVTTPAKTEGAEDTKTAAGSVEEGLQPARPANRPLSRPQGTVFIVHATSRKVLWSTFLKPDDNTPRKLHDQAKDVISRLRKDTKPATE